MPDIHTHVKHIVDGLSVSVVVATIVSLLPAVASLLSIVWMAIRIYETNTVQRWLGHSYELTLEDRRRNYEARAQFEAERRMTEAERDFDA
jgi:hypothetical protein